MISNNNQVYGNFLEMVSMIENGECVILDLLARMMQ